MSPILVIADDSNTTEVICALLRSEGFSVVTETDGVRATHRTMRLPVELILIDVALGGITAEDLCTRLRAISTVPIITLTTTDTISAGIACLEHGADDYLTSPIRRRECLARINSALRRSQLAPTPHTPLNFLLARGAVRMDLAGHHVTVCGKSVSLPPKEFTLLEVLLRHTGQMLTRRQLIDQVWGRDYSRDNNTLEVHIRRLRRKLEADPTRPQRIITVRGLGYRYQP